MCLILLVRTADNESACNTGDPGSIPGSGSSPTKVIGYPLQYSSAYLVAQMVKNPPAMWETWVRSLDWEDLLEKEMATHSSILTWKIPWTEEPGKQQSMGRKESDTTERPLFLSNYNSTMIMLSFFKKNVSCT